MDYTMQNITKSFPVYFILCIPVVLLKASSELVSIVILARSPVVLFKITTWNEWSHLPITMHPMLRPAAVVEIGHGASQFQTSQQS